MNKLGTNDICPCAIHVTWTHWYLRGLGNIACDFIDLAKIIKTRCFFQNFDVKTHNTLMLRANNWLRGLATVLICSSPLKWHSHYLTVVLHRRVEMGVRRRYKIERSAPPSSVITVPVM